MALYAFGKHRKLVTKIPHQLLFDGWKSWLDALQIQAINDEFEQIIANNEDGEIGTAGLLSASLSPLGRYHWEGSSFLPIWDQACGRDRDHTCWCFGLLLWEHMMNRPDAWNYRRFDLDHAPLAATKYYRCQVHSKPASNLTTDIDSFTESANSAL
jgi:hypothetical protein